MKGITENFTSKGLPALAGGAAAGALTTFLQTKVIAEMDEPKSADDFNVKELLTNTAPLIPGVVSLFFMDGKGKAMDFAAAGAMGYGAGAVVAPMVTKALGEEVLADDEIDEFLQEINEDSSEDDM